MLQARNSAIQFTGETQIAHRLSRVSPSPSRLCNSSSSSPPYLPQSEIPASLHHSTPRTDQNDAPPHLSPKNSPMPHQKCAAPSRRMPSFTASFFPHRLQTTDRRMPLSPYFLMLSSPFSSIYAKWRSHVLHSFSIIILFFIPVFKRKVLEILTVPYIPSMSGRC